MFPSFKKPEIPMPNEKYAKKPFSNIGTNCIDPNSKETLKCSLFTSLTIEDYFLETH